MSRSLVITYPTLPPSDNHIREVKTITAGRRFGKRNLMNVIGYTKEAENYKKELVSYIDEHFFNEVQTFVLGHKPTDVYLLEIRLYFPKWDVLNKGWLKKWTKDSKPGAKKPHKKGERKAKSPYKKLDTLNRRKLLEDGLSEALSIDDSLSWEANVVKLVLSDEQEHRVVLTLTKQDPTLYGVPEEFLRP